MFTSSSRKPCRIFSALLLPVDFLPAFEQGVVGLLAADAFHAFFPRRLHKQPADGRVRQPPENVMHRQRRQQSSRRHRDNRQQIGVPPGFFFDPSSGSGSISKPPASVRYAPMSRIASVRSNLPSVVPNASASASNPACASASFLRYSMTTYMLAASFGSGSLSSCDSRRFARRIGISTFSRSEST